MYKSLDFRSAYTRTEFSRIQLQEKDVEVENDPMQPDHEADDLQALLHDEYGAPQLDDQFSADLIARLQAEAALSSTPARTHSSPLAIGLVVAAAAVLVVAVVWISTLESPKTNHEVAQQAETDSTPSARPDESTDILRRVTDDGVDNMSLAESRSEALVINESLVENESQIASRPDSTSMALLSESRIASKSDRLKEAKPDFAREATEGENDSLPTTLLSSLSQVEPRIRSLALRSLEQSVAEAEVIVVATALRFDLAPPNRPGDARENFITFKVTRVLKGKLPDKVITTRTPTDPEVFIGKEWVVLLSPQYMAGKFRYAGLYSIKFEPEIDAILAGKR